AAARCAAMRINWTGPYLRKALWSRDMLAVRKSDHPGVGKPRRIVQESRHLRSPPRIAVEP
ncbi:MAG TPA: hypothetical protein VFV33_08100, partial [Gemmatimonadaceae bacterium]|nr:hypothetical protein [Gemmatimonadaceae bacterium]